MGRVVQLIDTGGPGGAETIFSVLARGLSDAGWTTIPVVPESGWLEDRLERAGLETVRQAARRSFDGGYLWRLVRLVRETGADLVHAHLLGSSVYGSMAAALNGLPAVCTFHGAVDVADPGLLDRTKFRLVDRLSSRVVFVSESLHRQLVGRMGITRAGTEVIPNGVDSARFPSSGDGGFRRELGVEDDEVLVGAVGNVRPAKDYGVFLRSAARLRERSDRYRFVIVGEHDNRLCEELREEQRRLGLDGAVTFTGLRDDVPELLADLDVFVLTSSSEGFSLSTVEALAAGRPVVATRCGGPEEIVTDGVDGRLVEPGSPEAVAEAVEEMVGNPENARRMAANGRRTVKREFSVDRMVARYEALYEDCLR